MRNSLLKLLTILLICVSCSETDDPIFIDPPTEPGYLRTLDLSASISNNSEILDFDYENGYLYFIYDIGIYRINLNSNTETVELILEDDIDWPNTLRVIENNVFYQADPSFSLSKNIKQLDLTNISAGVQTTHSIIGISRSQLGKNSNKLYYLSSTDGFSPTNNFYELNPSSIDQLIATDEFVFPQNMRVVDNYLYFSSKKEVRRFDLNNPSDGSSIVYTIISENTAGNNKDILGFDIKDNVIYYTLIADNKLFAKDLDQPNEDPIILKTNGDENDSGYGKLIIANGKLYVKKIVDKQLEVFEI